MNDRSPALRRLRDTARRAARRGRSVWRKAAAGWSRFKDAPATRRGAVVAAVLALGVGAAAAGLALVGGTKADIGPFDTTVSIHPDVSGETKVNIPPLGDIIFDSHDGPIGLDLSLDSIDPVEAQYIMNSPDGFTTASQSLASDVTDAVIRVAVEAFAIVTLCGLLVGALAFRNMRRALLTGVTSLTVTVALVGWAAATLRAEAVSQPRYEGLLTYAPSVVGSAENIAENYEEYVGDLQQIVTNISGFYTLAMDMPQVGIEDDSIRILHVSDLHLNPSAWHLMETVVGQFDIDAVADTGDMNDWGSEQEADIFSRGVEQIDAPYVFVKGNHDSATTVAALAAYDNVVILDGEVREIAGLRFAGVADPQFTPDKGNLPDKAYVQQMLTESGERLASSIEEAGGADVAMVHEPPMAEPLAGVVPLVLAGHMHERSVSDLGEGTSLMVEGSTGAGGLRHFTSSSTGKMEMDILYFDPDTKALTAYDSISVGAGDTTDVTLDRTVIPTDEQVDEVEIQNGAESTAPQED
ncbi:metallophosphoesterase family protein [Glycomyces artemisiae]|uniref:Putative MPP superfamily phosphohydrolase n=1 Tax=Glycomyces artemisiae TaxID=1076443 RepID=A0A2T0UK84_9ACTN|nr:metallophosphoesterase [Glycomyces artemisiae]PRY58343.1 putative MPP superfamily phosphohydrolase [Glycomyces artemisiae]